MLTSLLSLWLLDAQGERRLLALLLVYALHALVWATAAGALARWWVRRARTKHVLWLLALLGPLLTAGVSALHVGPQKRAFLIEAPHPLPLSRDIDGAGSATAAANALFTFRSPEVHGVLAALVPFVLLVGLVRLVASVLLLRRALSGRSDVVDVRLLMRFHALAERMGQPLVRLSESCDVPGPLVFGRREVCIPSGLLSSFADEEVDAIFAHEIAHVEHRDGVSFAAIGILDALLWAQPLHRWISSRCRMSAEIAADQRAVEVTRSPLDLARALARMAEASMAARHSKLMPAMGGSRSGLLERVRRLVNDSGACEQAVARPGALRAHWAPVACLTILGSLNVNVRGVVAPPQSPRALPPSDHDVPDRAVYLASLDSLSRRAWELESELLAQQQSNPANGEQQRLQTEQDLRHVRAMQAWTEQRLNLKTQRAAGSPTLRP